MGQTHHNDNIFALLRYDGPFASLHDTPWVAPFSRQAKELVRELRCTGWITKYRVLRNLILELLDVRSYGEVAGLLDNPEAREQVSCRAYRLLANMFGIVGNEREVVTRVNGYSRTADAVINYLRGKVLSSYAPYIEMTNEIDSIRNPVELLLILFDDRYHKKARFEAKRKLILMNLAASIDQRERETGIELKFSQFLDFLNQHVWSSNLKIGELDIAYLASHHDEATYACTDVKVLTPAQLEDSPKEPGRKLTLIKRRRFRLNGKELPIYVSVRKKPPEARVLKLLRKGAENPAVAVDDELGLMAVVDSVMEVKLFQKHLTRSASRAGSLMTLEEVSDTLEGGSHASGSIGRSKKTPMFKFFARMGGMRVEFIVHTNESYLNYMYQRGVSHDEYEVKRVFDSGVVELLFPKQIYHLDISDKKEAIIRWFRNRIEGF